MFLGLIQALAIIYEFFTKKWRLRLFSRTPDIFRIWFGRIVTYIFYSGSLVFFYSDSLNMAFRFFSKLADQSGPINLGPASRAPYMTFIYIPFLLLLELLANDFPGTYNRLSRFWSDEKRSRTLVRWTVYSIMIVLILIVRDKGAQFIYVNF